MTDTPIFSGINSPQIRPPVISARLPQAEFLRRLRQKDRLYFIDLLRKRMGTMPGFERKSEEFIRDFVEKYFADPEYLEKAEIFLRSQKEMIYPAQSFFYLGLQADKTPEEVETAIRTVVREGYIEPQAKISRLIEKSQTEAVASTAEKPVSEVAAALAQELQSELLLPQALEKKQPEMYREALEGTPVASRMTIENSEKNPTPGKLPEVPASAAKVPQNVPEKLSDRYEFQTPPILTVREAPGTKKQPSPQAARGRRGKKSWKKWALMATIGGLASTPFFLA